MITSIRLQNFRSYKDASFEFEPGVNIVVGPNASGKTNLLEAVLTLCQGKSFRVRDPDLVRFGAAWARLDGFFDNHDRVLKLEKPENGLEKTYLLDSKPAKRLNLEKMVPVVYFEPNHLQLVARGPSYRRDYFDEILEKTVADFKATNNAYKRTLAQRNSLLKSGTRGNKQLFVWDVRLSELGEAVAKTRSRLRDEINGGLGEAYSKVAKKKTEVRLDYISHFPVDSYASKMLAKLETSSALDFARGFTTFGPHREDFAIHINGQPAALSASRGEVRSLMLALKVLELELVEKARDQKPILLLDDVFSELDGARRRALVSYLKKHQTIITTTDADTVVEYFAGGNQKLISLGK